MKDRRHPQLLKRVAERVRALRDLRHWTQRELAERSGLSPRYLAQLEAGDANLSVERLADLGDALGVELMVLLSVGAALPTIKNGNGNSPEEAAQVRADIGEILGGREVGELREIRRALAVRYTRRTPTIIALLGLRGAGKSSVGRRLAARLKLPFVELDQRIAEVAGLKLPELFELHGEAYYRRLQHETLLAVLEECDDGVVLATGGGIVNDRDAYRLLKKRATTIWLKASPEDHWNRVVQQGDRRPMAKHPHAFTELRALFAARERLYSEAAHTVDTSARNVDAVAAAVASCL